MCTNYVRNERGRGGEVSKQGEAGVSFLCTVKSDLLSSKSMETFFSIGGNNTNVN